MKERANSSPATPGETAFTAALLAITLLLLMATRGLQPSAAVVPRVVGIPLGMLLVYRLVRETLSRTAGEQRQAPTPTRTRPPAIRAVAWLVALPASATVLGFVVGPAVWVVAWTRFRNRERMLVALIGGTLTAVVILGLFGELLDARLPAGVFEALI